MVVIGEVRVVSTELLSYWWLWQSLVVVLVAEDKRIVADCGDDGDVH